jgi:hypothetical protein
VQLPSTTDREDAAIADRGGCEWAVGGHFPYRCSPNPLAGGGIQKGDHVGFFARIGCDDVVAMDDDAGIAKPEFQAPRELIVDGGEGLGAEG